MATRNIRRKLYLTAFWPLVVVGAGAPVVMVVANLHDLKLVRKAQGCLKANFDPDAYLLTKHPGPVPGSQTAARNTGLDGETRGWEEEAVNVADTLVDPQRPFVTKVARQCGFLYAGPGLLSVDGT